MQDPPHLLHPELANPVISRARSTKTDGKEPETEKGGEIPHDESDGDALEHVETLNNVARHDTDLGLDLDLEPQPSPDLEEPPDGGFMAWAMCACAHIVLVNTWGIINSFGIFQAYYTDYLGISAFQISWIGSIQAFLGLIVGVVSGKMSDAGHFRLTLYLGTGFLLLGAFTMSVSTTYWQLILSQSVAIGLGAGFLVCPIMSVASTYFSKRKALAFGIITCGNSVGGLVYPAMARQLLPTVGFGWALRAMAFVQAATMIFVLVVARARVEPKKDSSVWVFAPAVDLEYGFYLVGSFFAYAGIFTVLYFMVQYSRDGIPDGLSYPDSLNLVLIFHGVNTIGRLVPAWLANRLGVINMLIFATFWNAVCGIGWIGVSSKTGVYAWTTLYAIVGGGLLSLFPSGAVALTEDLQKVGQRMGMLFAFQGFSSLAGPPIGGAIITATGGYEGTQAYAAVCLMLGAMFVGVIKVLRRRNGEDWRAIV